MPKFAANISTMYPHVPFAERIDAAAQDGFRAVECQFPYDVAPQILRDALASANVELVLLNTPPGDFAAGDRGLGCDPARRMEFRENMMRALEYARALDCPNIHVMAGIPPPNVDATRVRDTYIQNLAWAAHAAGTAGKTALIEPINTRDIPGYYLNHQAKAHAIVRAIGSPHLKVQFDLYHAQVVEGDLATKLTQYLPTGLVGHIQIAGTPERAEPSMGEINYPYLFDLIDHLGYEGWIGAEYKPAGSTRGGLGWLAPYKAGVT